MCSCVSEGEKKQSSFSPLGQDKQGANGHSCVVMVMPDAKRNDGDIKLTTPAATKLQVKQTAAGIFFAMYAKKRLIESSTFQRACCL